MAKTSVTTNESSLKRKFYRWHRILGLTALIPVIFWTLSGLSHPFMSNWFRPFIAEEVFHPASLQKMKPGLSLQEVMDRNRIGELRNFTLVSFNNVTYYQLQVKDSTYQYYSAINGKLLRDGDRDYAIFLARYFTNDQKSAVISATVQTTFDGKYQPINRLLPVWKISFQRPDGMDVYVETQQSRMGTFNTHLRKNFLWIFDQFHTWRFLAAIGGEGFRITVLLCIVSIMLLALISGLTVYGLYWKKFKDVRKKQKLQGIEDRRFIHRYHRQIGIIVSVVMLTFFVSGAFHLAVKMYNLAPEGKKVYQQLIRRNELQQSSLTPGIPDSMIARTSLIRFNSQVYYQVLTNERKTLYVNAANGDQLENGDQLYATYLSRFYRGDNQKALRVTAIDHFTNDYGFINKRLPVQEISYPGNEDWYIETSSAKLAEKVEGVDRTEGLSFIFLHKFLWMSWAGKDVRDIVSILAAAGVLLVALLGLFSFIKNK